MVVTQSLVVIRWEDRPARRRRTRCSPHRPSTFDYTMKNGMIDDVGEEEEDPVRGEWK